MHTTMKTILLAIILTIALPIASMAQKKEISQARANIKAGNNLAQAEQQMSRLLEDSDNIRNKKIWITMLEAIKKQYDQGNEKLYLKQQYDTAALFNTCHRLFVQMQRFDSIDALPAKDGKIRPEYRRRHADMLNLLRPNLYNGAIYYIGKAKYADAYNCLSIYIDCDNSPLFSHYNYGERDTLMPKAAYWATYCGYKLKNPQKTLHHTYLALKIPRYWEPMLQYLSATYLIEKDTARYLKTLDEGFNRYPTNAFFYSQLVAHYAEGRQWQKALDVCTGAIQHNPKDSLLLITESTIMLNLQRYDECLTVADSIISRYGPLPEAYLNAGLACFNKGVTLGMAAKRKNDKAEMLRLYRKALPYLQQAQKALPNLKDKWALPLYTIYLNLNMGREFEEIDKIIKQ